jgi:class 3 adenylate cyclase
VTSNGEDRGRADAAPRGQKHRWLSLALGVLVIACVAAAQAAGWFDAAERRTIDLRFAHTQWRDHPMSDEIRHVDIDESSLHSIGRWPWPRSVLADALDEIQRAGARTIAVDQLLSEPTSLRHPAEGGAPIDDDAVLAAAVGRTRSVLATRLAAPSALIEAEEWPERLLGLLDRLDEDITAEATSATQGLGLAAEERDRFLTAPLAFKEAAARRALRRMSPFDQEPLAFDAYLERITRDASEHLGDFPERPMLMRVWKQHEAWRHLQPHLLPGRSLEHQGPAPPISKLAASASGVGFVDFEHDPDNAVRGLALRRPAVGGEMLQFGLAAAALHRGVDPQSVSFTSDAIQLGDQHIGLEDERLFLAWPTTATDWTGLLRRSAGDGPTAGHVSIGALVSLARERRRLADLHRQLEAVTRELGADLFGSEELTDAQREEIPDEVAFRLEDAQAQRAEGPLSAEERDLIAPYEHWRLLTDGVGVGATRLATAEAWLRAALHEKLVFVGFVYTGAASDVVSTPLGAATPGVVVNAVVADMALSGRSLRKPPAWSGFALTVLLGVLCTLATLLPFLGSLLLAALVLSGFGAASLWLFGGPGWVVPVSAPLIGGAAAWVGCTALVGALSQRDRQRILRQFRARVSTQLVDYLVNNEKVVSVGGEEREVTVLFTDLAGFTAVSESLDGPAVVALLNRVMGALTRNLIARGAYVNKFLGDGVMAFWSAFVPEPNQAEKACRAALACQEAIERINAESPEGAPQLSARVGITTGSVIVGDCGAPPDLNDYTVIGDNVNLSARLESANKQFGTGIMVNGRTRAEARDTDLKFRYLGRLVVVGQTIPVRVFELMPAGVDPALIELTDRAVNAYAEGEFDESEQAWQSLVDRFGPSKLATAYRAAIKDARVNPDKFHGAIHLLQK